MPDPGDQSRPLLAELVVVDPEILGGTPVFRGTRVPIRSLFDYLQAGDNLETFLDDFEGVAREQAEGVLALAMSGLVQGLRAA